MTLSFSGKQGNTHIVRNTLGEQEKRKKKRTRQGRQEQEVYSDNKKVSKTCVDQNGQHQKTQDMIFISTDVSNTTCLPHDTFLI